MEKTAGKLYYILDTNVLLNDINIINTLENAIIVLPQIVLVELDKIKFSRADIDLKYRARQVARKLFEYTEQGNLSEGIEIGNSSILKVIVPEPTGEIPVAIKTRSADDQILALAYHLNKNGNKAVIITSDINMIVKAQAIGIPTRKHEVRESKKFMALIKSRRWQKRIVGIFMVLLILFLSIPTIKNYVSANYTLTGNSNLNQQLAVFHQQEKHYTELIKRNPQDVNALISLGNLYFSWKQWNKAIQYYNKVLQLNPQNWDIQVDMSIALFNTGNSEAAIKGLNDVIKANPDHAMAQYNLAAIYQQLGKHKEAIEKYTEYKRLEPQGNFVAEAELNIQRLKLLIDK